MLAMNPIIVLIMLLVPSLCDDPPKADLGSPEEFLKEVNEFRAKFAKEHKIPNMYKLVWSKEIVGQILIRMNINIPGVTSTTTLLRDFRNFHIPSFRNSTGLIDAELGKFKNQSEFSMHISSLRDPIELILTLQKFIGCITTDPADGRDPGLYCFMSFGKSRNFWFTDPGEAGSQCPPRFKGEDGLCVPADSSKFSFWGTEGQLLKDVNYMRRKYAKKLGVPNMHQLTWNESLVEVIKTLDWDDSGSGTHHVLNKSASDSWRFAQLITFSAAATSIDEAVHNELVLNQPPEERYLKGKWVHVSALELIHPVQTSIGCMKLEVTRRGGNSISTMCLIGNMPSEWKFDVNSKKIPGSECMDGYVNDDGLCSLPLPTSAPKPIPSVTKKPEVSGALEFEQEEAESSSTTELSYGLWIIYLLLSFF